MLTLPRHPSLARADNEDTVASAHRVDASTLLSSERHCESHGAPQKLDEPRPCEVDVWDAVAVWLPQDTPDFTVSRDSEIPQSRDLHSVSLDPQVAGVLLQQVQHRIESSRERFTRRVVKETLDRVPCVIGEPDQRLCRSGRVRLPGYPAARFVSIPSRMSGRSINRASVADITMAGVRTMVPSPSTSAMYRSWLARALRLALLRESSSMRVMCATVPLDTTGRYPRH